MLVVSRFTVAALELGGFRQEAEAALTALGERPGFLRGRVARAVDDESTWLLVSEWESVGAYRRALGGYDVKVHATPVVARSHDEPSAFEDLLVLDAAGARRTASDRARDADTVRVGEAAGPTRSADI
ncbi:MAG TPA: antibiotic biosynthesis monooxygenase [Mycobacteriales bacterium]|nr:antibiotic biosynthesis monooxygenase [Mycobacteriales bacterium]